MAPKVPKSFVCMLTNIFFKLEERKTITTKVTTNGVSPNYFENFHNELSFIRCKEETVKQYPLTSHSSRHIKVQHKNIFDS